MNLGQTEWSDDESDNESNTANTDQINDNVSDADKGLVIKSTCL